MDMFSFEVPNFFAADVVALIAVISATESAMS